MNIELPQVSIGLPVYNAEEYLAGAIDSILAQTFPHFELVISDNGSSDVTEAICRRHAAADPRIRYERHEQNRGGTWNFNRVFQVSRGEYFKWAAHDDLLSPAFLQACVDVLDRQADVAWCHSRSRHAGPDGRPLAGAASGEVTYAAGGLSAPSRESADPANRFRAILLGTGGCMDAYGLIRRDILKSTMLFLPYYGSEKVLMGELALRGRYHEIAETMFFNRVHARAASCLATTAEQVRFENPKAVPWLTFTRLHLLRGHVQAVTRAPLGRRQRIRCYGVILEYLMQFRKWKAVLAQTLRAQGMGDGAVAPNATRDGYPDVNSLHDKAGEPEGSATRPS